jgi:hypothetical protein
MIWRAVVRAVLLVALAALSRGAHSEDVDNAREIRVVTNLEKAQPAAGASIFVVRPGEDAIEGLTDENGRYRFAAWKNDALTQLVIKKPTYRPIAKRCPCNDSSYKLERTIEEGQGRNIVLTWGNKSLQLTALLVFPSGDVPFGNTWYPGVRYEQDVFPFTQETISINKHFNERAVYVVNWDPSADESDGTDALGYSDAVVRVFEGDHVIRTFHSTPGKFGHIWTVFAMDPNGDFSVIDQYRDPNREWYRYQELGDWVKGYPEVIKGHGVTDRDIRDSTTLMRQGELSYKSFVDSQSRDGIISAMELYKQALDLNPANGIAWCDLGLAYSRWYFDHGDRAAVAYKNGLTVSTGQKYGAVRAACYFGLAQGFEKESAWDKALQNYMLAEREYHRREYGEAIARINGRVKKHAKD